MIWTGLLVFLAIVPVFIQGSDLNTNCGNNANFTELSGKIRFPAIGNEYSNNVECRWLVNVAPNILVFNLTNIDMECGYDYVAIYDDPAYQNETNRYCSVNSVVSFRESGVIYIKVVTDSIHYRSGFNLTWNSTRKASCSSVCHPNASCVRNTCICNNGYFGDGIKSCTYLNTNCGNNANFTELSGKIRFPAIGNEYSNNVECRWLVNVAPNILVFSLTNIDMECGYDYVAIYDDPAYQNETNRYCSVNSVVSFRESGVIYIKVVTDSIHYRSGFNLTWNSTRKASCSSVCHPNASCVGNTCICNNGYFGDGIKSCTSNCSSLCHPDASCVRETCICNSGYFGDGVKNCTRVEKMLEQLIKRVEHLEKSNVILFEALKRYRRRHGYPNFNFIFN